MNPPQKVTLFIGLLLCALWVYFTRAGSSSGGHFYAYPVNEREIGFWAIGWVVILVPTFLLIKKLRKK